MATFSGNDGSVKIGTSTVAELLTWTLSEGVEIIPDTATGDSSDSHKVGTANWSGSVNCYWDSSDTTGQEAMTNGASVVLHLLPSGATTGDIDFTGTATVSGIERVQGNNAIVTANFTFTGNGGLTRAVLA